MELRSTKLHHSKTTPEMASPGMEDHADPTKQQPLTLDMLRSELQSSQKAVLTDIKAEMSTMRQEILNDIAALREETKADVRSIRRELANELTVLTTKQAELATEQTEMASSLNDTMDRVAVLEQSIDNLSKENKTLQDKCLDLECRGRRNNLKCFYIGEHSEAGSPVSFMSTFFTTVLGPENFQTPIVVDRAHRLGPKPKNRDDKPRVMIVRLHYFSDREKIIELARKKGSLTYNGSPVLIHPDVPQAIAKLRATYGPIKAKLREAKLKIPGLDYSLYHPARFTVTLDGIRYSLKDPAAAEEFYKKRIASAATQAAEAEGNGEPAV